MRFRRAFLAALFLGLIFSLGNVPAPYYACAGKAEGDPCTWGYSCGNNGRCAFERGCTDDPGTDIDECLVCNTRRD